MMELVHRLGPLGNWSCQQFGRPEHVKSSTSGHTLVPVLMYSWNLWVAIDHPCTVFPLACITDIDFPDSTQNVSTDFRRVLPCRNATRWLVVKGGFVCFLPLGRRFCGGDSSEWVWLEHHGDQLLRLSGCNPNMRDSANVSHLPGRFFFFCGMVHIDPTCSLFPTILMSSTYADKKNSHKQSFQGMTVWISCPALAHFSRIPASGWPSLASHWLLGGSGSHTFDSMTLFLCQTRENWSHQHRWDLNVHGSQCHST